MPDTQHNSHPVVLGVDLGGTKIAAGRVNSSAEVLTWNCGPTGAADGFEASFKRLLDIIESQLSPDVSAVGVCAPGPLNPKTGVIINPPNLPGWNDIPLAQRISDRFGLPCRVENDANAAGLAEAKFGAGRGFENVFYASLGTGIGSGIILNGKIFHGKNGAAAEGGHVTVDYRSTAICNCGVPGCIEALASGAAIAARQNLDQTTDMLAAWLGSIVSLLDPDIVVIGGGVAKLGAPLFDLLRQKLPARTINRFVANLPIVSAALGDYAGIVGAAAAFL